MSLYLSPARRRSVACRRLARCRASTRASVRGSLRLLRSDLGSDLVGRPSTTTLFSRMVIFRPFEIDVAPPHAADLTAAKPGQGEQPGRFEAIGPRGGEHFLDLSRGISLHLLLTDVHDHADSSRQPPSSTLLHHWPFVSERAGVLSLLLPSPVATWREC
jgi:hypothetical protein